MPAPSVAFDRMADRYDETRGGEARGALVAGLVAPHLPPGRVLEIGVGTGLVAAALGATGRVVTGVDLSVPMLVHAAARVPGRVAQADAAALPVASGSVAGVAAVWVLHLVGDRPAVFGEARRVLRPDGRLVVVGTEESAGDDDVTVSLAPLLAALAPRPTPAHLLGEARDAGLTVVERFDHEVAVDVVPSVVAAAFESRTWSSLWDVDDATWEGKVVPAIAALRALPDPDGPRPGLSRMPVLVLGPG